MIKAAEQTEVRYKIQVNSEIGRLRRVLIHSPDGGIGKVVPRKAEDLLYEDIVDLVLMQEEYDHFVKILLYFLDHDAIVGKKQLIQKSIANKDTERPQFFVPNSPHYYQSNKVLDTQKLLAELLAENHENAKLKLVAAVCALENATQHQPYLMSLEPDELANVLLSGFHRQQNAYLFPPIPNFIFTRDISITINDHLLLSKTAYSARKRESILIKYIASHIFFKDEADRMIDLVQDSEYSLLSEKEQAEQRMTIEGGDVMMIAPGHLLVGYSQRTSPKAVEELIKRVFSMTTASGEELLTKVTVIRVPPKRDWMHIDTIMSHVRKDVWALYGPLSRKGKEKIQAQGFSYVDRLNGKEKEARVKIYHFDKHKYGKNLAFDSFKDYQNTPEGYHFEDIEDLCKYISCEAFGCEKVHFVYSGNNVFPHDEREQWTDSCNMLVLKNGVAIAYDRNRKTNAAFRDQLRFKLIKAKDLIEHFENGTLSPDEVENTLILLPSSELSRARGGSHCLSMPLLRDEI